MRKYCELNGPIGKVDQRVKKGAGVEVEEVIFQNTKYLII